MRLRADILQQLVERLGQLGLSHCPVCNSQALGVMKVPTILHTGGVSAETDGDSNILYALNVRCDLCGYLMLFDTEKFYSGDNPIFVTYGHDDPSET